MPAFSNSRRVHHSAAEMFDLVADIEAYPDFVPLCKNLRIRRRSEDAEGRVILVADMEAGYKAIHEKFTSKVTCDRAKLTILAEYIDGPFKSLENHWTFSDDIGGKPMADAVSGPICRVDFAIAYEFKSRMLAALVGGMFDTAFRKFASAFEQRADTVYRRG
jgi:coenzyme Q-binding protein COQ10